jgi:hypothetical protein
MTTTTKQEDAPPPAEEVTNDNNNDNNDKDNEDPAEAAAVQDIALQAMQVVEGTAAVDNDNDDDVDAEAEAGAPDNSADNDNGENSSATPKKKRLCRYPNCTRVIKSQGHCQRHGAKAKRCKVQGCDKQAQGTHDGMCKRHWKTIHFPQQPTTASQL